MKKRRAFIVVSYPPDSRDLERFGLKDFQKAGYVAELVDMSEVFFPLRAAMSTQSRKSNRVLRICTLAELNKFSKTLVGRDLLILATFPNGYATLRQLIGMKLIFSSPATLGLRVGSHSVPVKPEKSPALSERLRKLINSARITIEKARTEKLTRGNQFLGRLIAEKLFLRVLSPFKRLLFGRKADFVWFGTEIPSSLGYLVGKNTILRRIHHLDYDQVLEAEETIPPTENAGIVWIDPMGPFHPDILESRVQYKDMKSWINEIRSLLFALEMTFDTRVSVAAHPRSTSKSLRNTYHGFRVFRDETYNLVRHSSLIVSAGSTALGWGALHKKPMILVMPTSEHPYARDIILAQSAALHIPILFLPADIDKLRVPPVDYESYDSYVKKFLKPTSSKEAPFWPQVIESVELSAPNRPATREKLGRFALEV